METLSVLAHLPGEYVFIVLDQSGQTCIWSLNGLLPVPSSFLQSAIAKHGYKDLRSLGVTALPDQIKELTDHLNSLD